MPALRARMLPLAVLSALLAAAPARAQYSVPQSMDERDSPKALSEPGAPAEPPSQGTLSEPPGVRGTSPSSARPPRAVEPDVDPRRPSAPALLAPKVSSEV